MEATNESVDAAPVVAGDATFDPSLRALAARMGSAWSRGDLDACLALLDPEVEFSPELDGAGTPIWPDLRPVYRRHEGFRQVWHDWHSGFEGDATVEVIGVVYGTGCFATLNRHRVVGRGGVTAERDIAHTFEVRDGLIWRFRNHARWEHALAALGMPTGLTPGAP